MVDYYVCIYVCVCICMCVYMYVCVYVCVCDKYMYNKRYIFNTNDVELIKRIKELKT